MSYYPAIVFPPDENGLVGCIVPDLMVNATGQDRESALADAVRSMDELLSDLSGADEPFPEPTSIDDLDTEGGVLVLLHARTSQAA